MNRHYFYFVCSNFKNIFTSHQITNIAIILDLKLIDFRTYTRHLKIIPKSLKSGIKNVSLCVTDDKLRHLYNSHGGNEFNLSTSHSNCERLDANDNYKITNLPQHLIKTLLPFNTVQNRKLYSKTNLEKPLLK